MKNEHAVIVCFIPVSSGKTPTIIKANAEKDPIIRAVINTFF